MKFQVFEDGKIVGKFALHGAYLFETKPGNVGAGFALASQWLWQGAFADYLSA